jgi:hypothetical protein
MPERGSGFSRLLLVTGFLCIDDPKNRTGLKHFLSFISANNGSWQNLYFEQSQHLSISLSSLYFCYAGPAKLLPADLRVASQP